MRCSVRLTLAAFFFALVLTGCSPSYAAACGTGAPTSPCAPNSACVVTPQSGIVACVCCSPKIDGGEDDIALLLPGTDDSSCAQVRAWWLERCPQ